ncbi:hypothetical protein BJ997_001537 [Cryobacterium roopkundense]|uniref:Anti-bacteriophage protein A/HamA C-terminal domain-containing protein n=2 Tax=Cryobacterium roopkundense TaxID=1001240 RepID=A0A7W9E425_9MICO|nr:hypothetical protein [Cryobacterium roopkundense]
MTQFSLWTTRDDRVVGTHRLSILEMDESKFDDAVAVLIPSFTQHYIKPERLERALRRGGRRAEIALANRTPTTSRTRSGDFGEILGTNYLKEELNYMAVFRLRWKDNAKLPMRGDDLLGVRVNIKNELEFLKGEAKSGQRPGASVISKARQALDQYNGMPNPVSVAFLVDRLEESGEVELSDRVDDVMTEEGITADNVEHLLFIFSGTDASSLVNNDIGAQGGRIAQVGVVVRAVSHQKLIQTVFDGVVHG